MTKKLFLIIITAIIFSCCNDEFPENCVADKKAIEHRAFAEGSYLDFNSFALYTSDNNSKINLSMEVIDSSCFKIASITVNNLNLKNLDTVIIKKNVPDQEPDVPQSRHYISDGDALIETYRIDENEYNWLILDFVNEDETIIEGQFQLSFLTSYEPYLSGERIRWDDPNRPNKLQFTNGTFSAFLME